MSETTDYSSILDSRKDNFAKLDSAELTQNLRWQNEIAMLERRVNTLYEDVDLGNGDKIAVRTALSDEEAAEYNALDLKKQDATPEEQSEIMYQQLEMLTANPLMTADWFRVNRDKWPVNDALAIVVGATEKHMQTQIDRVNHLKRFRDQ